MKTLDEMQVAIADCRTALNSAEESMRVARVMLTRLEIKLIELRQPREPLPELPKGFKFMTMNIARERHAEAVADANEETSR